MEKSLKQAELYCNRNEKNLSKKVKGCKPNAVEPLTISEENKLKEEGCIGIHSPKALFNR